MDADETRAAAHFAAVAPFLEDPLPCSGPVVDVRGTGTLMPLQCFQCGMLLNNKQEWYEEQLGKPDAPPPQALFEALHLDLDCCRIIISRSARDPRLHFDPVFTSSLVTIDRASRLQAPPTTLPTDGRTQVYYNVGLGST
jgi:DNA-directed RNA polymerase subunit N (RpoN/RPB10)